MTEQQQGGKEARIDVKAEMDAIAGTLKLFDRLGTEGKRRAFAYLANALGFADASGTAFAGRSSTSVPGRSAGSSHNVATNVFQTFADIHDAARPETGPEKALVGGFWFQVCQRAETFPAADVNKALTDVVGPLSNVTVAFDALKALKPAQVIQVGKSGKAQQARKQYKLTLAGIRAVEAMIARKREM
jgi:hypothetical protein